jgi:3-mercaptopyruvate sulfurtransferase SseA
MLRFHAPWRILRAAGLIGLAVLALSVHAQSQVPADFQRAHAALAAQPVSAATAQQRLAAGAAVWDVRPEGDAHLPGAVRLDAVAVQRWLREGDLAALAAAASAAGLNLSTEVLVYGTAGDPTAQAISQRLPNVVRGQVHWLVGGLPEWQALGLPTQVRAERKLALPQRLSAWLPAAEAAAVTAPAAASLRRTEDASAAVSWLTASLR